MKNRVFDKTMAPGQSIDKTMAQKSYVMSDPNMLDMLTVMHKTLGVTIAAARSDPANPPNVSGAELMTAPIVSSRQGGKDFTLIITIFERHL